MSNMRLITDPHITRALADLFAQFESPPVDWDATLQMAPVREQRPIATKRERALLLVMRRDRGSLA